MPLLSIFFGSCGGWDRTNDLQVMSLTSYHCSTPRCCFGLQKYNIILKWQNVYAFLFFFITVR